MINDGSDLATYDRAAELADLSLLAEFDQMPVLRTAISADDLIYDEDSLDALVNSSPPRAQTVVVAAELALPETPAPAKKEPARPTVQIQTAGPSGSYSLMYRVGLCLTLILTGQFYIFRGKRVASS